MRDQDAEAGAPNAKRLREHLREQSDFPKRLRGDAPLDASRGAVVFMPSEDKFYNYAGPGSHAHHRRGLPSGEFLCCREIIWMHAAPSGVAGMVKGKNGKLVWCRTFLSVFEAVRIMAANLSHNLRDKPLVVLWMDVFPATDYLIPEREGRRPDGPPPRRRSVNVEPESSVGSVETEAGVAEGGGSVGEHGVGDGGGGGDGGAVDEEAEESVADANPDPENPEWDPDYEPTFEHDPRRGRPLGDIEPEEAESVAFAMMKTSLEVAARHEFILNLCSRKMSFYLEKFEKAGRLAPRSRLRGFGAEFAHPCARWYFKAGNYAAHVLYGDSESPVRRETKRRFFAAKCEHGYAWRSQCPHCNGCFHGKLKYHCKVCNGCSHGRMKNMCAACNPCPHGRVKGNCVDCNGCPHGKLKRDCAKCSPCPHGRVKRDCAKCKPCPHGKLKSNCAKCNPCPHGKRKDNCAKCTGCPHGKRKDNCAKCTGCPHGKRKYDCVKCTGCPHGKLKSSCTACTGCPHGRVRRDCADCNPCPHGKVKRYCTTCTGCEHGKRKGRCPACKAAPEGQPAPPRKRKRE